MSGSGLIEDFISSQVIRRGLDKRTEKAYRLDLEHFYKWLETDGEYKDGGRLSEDTDSEKEEIMPTGDTTAWQGKIEQYLTYLSWEKRLRSSTIFRKYRVFGYFLAYLVNQGVLSDNGTPKQIRLQTLIPKADLPEPETGSLSKMEVDMFFQAIRQEQQELDSDFRRRICLRDQTMMGLLFYHGIEISELLKMEVSDYERKSGNLTIRRKREKAYSVRLFSGELRDQMERWLDEHEYFERHEEFRGRMFLSKLGRPLSMKMVILIFEKYRLLAGIEKEFTPKDLKNSLGRYGRELVREQCEGRSVDK